MGITQWCEQEFWVLPKNNTVEKFHGEWEKKSEDGDS
jgi:hypothetical protein